MTIEATGALPTVPTPTGTGNGFSSPNGLGGASSSGKPALGPVPQPAASASKTTSSGGQLQINVDAQTSQVVISVVDGSTKEIIKKIPAEEVVEFAQTLDSPAGNLIKTKA
ncbi:MAG: flagellar protein FlaG [Burkholderiaceae bacterium]